MDQSVPQAKAPKGDESQAPLPAPFLVPVRPWKWWGTWIVAWALGLVSGLMVVLQIDFQHQGQSPSPLPLSALREVLVGDLKELGHGLDRLVPILVQQPDKIHLIQTRSLSDFGVKKVALWNARSKVALPMDLGLTAQELTFWLSERTPGQLIGEPFRAAQDLDQDLLHWHRLGQRKDGEAKLWASRKTDAGWVIAQIHEPAFQAKALARLNGLASLHSSALKVDLWEGPVATGVLQVGDKRMWQSSAVVAPYFPWILVAQERGQGSVFYRNFSTRHLGLLAMGFGFAFFLAGAIWVDALRKRARIDSRPKGATAAEFSEEDRILRHHLLRAQIKAPTPPEPSLKDGAIVVPPPPKERMSDESH